MFFNKFFWYKILAGFLILAVPGVVVGSYFAISQQDKYRTYYVTPTNDTTRGFIDAYKNAVYNGAEVILAPGFTHRTPIIASFNEYGSFFSDKGFLLYDESIAPQTFNGEQGPQPGTTNTWSIMFRSDLGSIQCGIALGVFLNQYQDVFFDDDHKLTYATYGGQPFSSVTSFMGGLQKGVDWFNNNLALFNTPGNNSMDNTRHIDYQPVQQMFTSSGTEFAGGFGPGEGATLSENLISRDVDAIIPVAGPQTWTAMNQIIKLNKKTILLGVDSAAEDDKLNKPLNFTSKYGPIGNGNYVQFSSIKNLSLATFKALQIINNGNVAPENEDPNYFNEFIDPTTREGGFGTVAVGNIKNGCTGISEAGKSYFLWALEKTKLADPALDPQYSNPDNMYYKGLSENFSYGNLQQNFISLNKEFNLTPLNLKDFIQKSNGGDSNKIKVCLSGSTSILMDGSFSESCYTGLYNYYKFMDISIPNNKATNLALYNEYLNYELYRDNKNKGGQL